MKAFTSTSSPTSGSIISGVPAVVTFYQQYSKRFPEALEGALHKVLSEYEKQVRDNARSLWGDVSNGITISFDPATASIAFDVTPEYADQAETLEFGSPDESPRAIMRMAAVEANQTLPLKLEQELARRLGA
jgi:hypothetical protein